jgi:hypothetical protein
MTNVVKSIVLNERALAASLVKHNGIIALNIANDIAPRLRTPSEWEIRTIVRKHATALNEMLIEPVRSGEALKDPVTYFGLTVASLPNLQRSIVLYGSKLSSAEIENLQPGALVNACVEVIEFVRCIYSLDQLTEFVFSELRKFLSGLPL